MRVLVPTSRTFWKVNFSFWDAVWLLASPILALYLRDEGIVFRADWAIAGIYWIAAATFSVVGLLIFRVQDEIAHHFSIDDAFDLAKAVAFAEFATCIALFFLTRLEGIPRSTLIIHGLLLAAGLVARRAVFSFRHRKDATEDHSQYGYTIIIGANRLTSSLIRLLNVWAPHQQNAIAVLDERRAMIGRTISGVPIIGTPQHLGAIVDEFIVHGIRTDKVIVAGEDVLLDQNVMREVRRVCDDRRIKLNFLPDMIGRAPAAVASHVPNSEERSLGSRRLWRLKRGIDIAASVALLILLFPLYMTAAFLVLLDVGAPILFWQRRVGHQGCFFDIYKFRTLRPPFDADGNRIPESGRLSAIGRLLRMTRIDELPQALNVLKGDMSLVGPRPLLPEDQPSDTGLRLLVRPGITGWAQVNGGKLVTPDEKGTLDDWYVRNASFLLDLQIIFMTLKVLFAAANSPAESLADAEQAQRSKTLYWRVSEPLKAPTGTGLISPQTYGKE
jgi:lipopolysaccharide/colanic/teichoic acid biosynthesis glycosyltransferase